MMIDPPAVTTSQPASSVSASAVPTTAPTQELAGSLYTPHISQSVMAAAAVVTYYLIPTDQDWIRWYMTCEGTFDILHYWTDKSGSLSSAIWQHECLNVPVFSADAAKCASNSYNKLV